MVVLNQFFKQLVVAALLATYILPANAADTVDACDTDGETCLESCKRFNVGDPRHSACNGICQKKSRCAAPDVRKHELPLQASAPIATAEPAPVVDRDLPAPSETAPDLPAQDLSVQSADAEHATAQEEKQSIDSSPQVPVLSKKKDMSKELEKNAWMRTAIKTGNLNAIRRLIQVQGLNATYVYSYELNPQTRLYEGKATRLRLSDVLGDTSMLRKDASGPDHVLALFLELGMDIKATVATAVPADPGENAAVTYVQRTAWGPSLRQMETARDRAARLRAFELALQTGLMPNDDFSEWLFAELPQVCGRDRSTFAIQVVDLLIKYLGPPMGSALQDSFWRVGTHGPETVSDVLDLSVAPPNPKTPREKALFAQQDEIWEQCVPLSRRVNRFLMQGN